MVVFVPPEAYLTAYDRIRQAYRSSSTPVHIFCLLSVDTAATWCLLQKCFEADSIAFELHVVYTRDDVHAVISSHSDFQVDEGEKNSSRADEPEEESVQLILLNCGATLDLTALLPALHRFHVHVMDSVGSVALSTLLHPSARLYLWDGGNLQQELELYFRDAWRTQKRESKRQRYERKSQRSTRTSDATQEGESTQRKHAKSDPSLDFSDDSTSSSSEDETDSDSEPQPGAPPQKPRPFSWSTLQDLSAPRRAAYLRSALPNTSPSLFWFEISRQLRPTMEEDTLWFRALALTAYHHPALGLPSPSPYTTEMLRIQDAVNVFKLSKSDARALAPPPVVPPRGRPSPPGVSVRPTPGPAPRASAWWPTTARAW